VLTIAYTGSPGTNFSSANVRSVTRKTMAIVCISLWITNASNF
jgi:hypothetical protein